MGSVVRAVERVFGCTGDAAAEVAAAAQLRAWPARAPILHLGDATDDSFILVSGGARAVAFGQGGQATMIATYRSGDLFGALPGEGAVEMESEIVAETAVECLCFRATDLLALAEARAAVGHRLTRALVARLATMSRRMVAQVTLTASGRVHQELLRLAVDTDGGAQIVSPAPVLTELAARLSTTRETVSRTVSALERRGIVRREPGQLVIAAPGRLREMVV
ncbi:MAG: Crp/Fnr family transcriptional regulator [Pseudomonadota bacterium]